MSMGVSVVARDLDGQLVVLHTERHFHDLPDGLPLIDDELALSLGLFSVGARFTRVNEGELFELEEDYGESTSLNPLVARFADAIRVDVRSVEVDEIAPEAVVAPSEAVAAQLNAELEDAFLAFAPGSQPGRVAAPNRTLAYHFAKGDDDEGDEREERARHREQLRESPVPQGDIDSYFIMRAGYLLGVEGRPMAPWSAVMPHAADAVRSGYLAALNAALAETPAAEREVLVHRQMSEWGEVSSIAEQEARFGMETREIVALEAAANARRCAAARAWRSANPG